MKKYQLLLILTVTLLLINGLLLPERLSFRQSVCGDPGSAMLAAKMLERGIQPYRDYNYNYGLVPFWINQAWYKLFGCSPVSNGVLNIVCAILLCWAITEFIVVMNLNKPVTVLVLLSAPFLFVYLWFTTAHTLEATLISSCLVRYLKRAWASALFLATLALLVKSGLAYFVGLYLVIGMLSSREDLSLLQHVKRFLWNILPSLLLLVFHTVLVLSIWGSETLLGSLLPISGMLSYIESGLGIFGRVTMFWLPQVDTFGQLLQHYLFTPAGLWVLGNLVLFWCTIKTCIHWSKTRTLSLSQRAILFCGTIQFAFIAFVIGNEWAWTYTLYLVIFGIAAILNMRPRISWLVLPVYALFVAMSLSGNVRSALDAWQTNTLRPDLHDTFVTDALYQELVQLRQLAGRCRVLVLGRQGAPSLIIDGVQENPTWTYMEQSVKGPEKRAMQQLIDQADVVVIPNYYYLTVMADWPQVAEHLKRMTVRKSTDHFLYFTTEKHRSLFPSGK